MKELIITLVIFVFFLIARKKHEKGSGAISDAINIFLLIFFISIIYQIIKLLLF